MSMNPPDFTFDKIKFAADKPTFEKAIELYEQGKVTQVEEGVRSYTAIVQGTENYRVSVEARDYHYAHCTCYQGQRDMLCKHILALAIYVVNNGRQLTQQDISVKYIPMSSGKSGELSGNELQNLKQKITSALRYIKPYHGPSRLWYAYQQSLSEGCTRLSTIVSELPVSEQTAQILVDLLLRLDKKLCTGGIDDSDGVVGGYMEDLVHVLKEYAKIDKQCINAFTKLQNIESCFGWERPLVEISDVRGIN